MMSQQKSGGAPGNQVPDKLVAGQVKEKELVTIPDHLQKLVMDGRMNFATQGAQATEVMRTVFEGTIGQLSSIILQQDQLIQSQQKLLVESKLKLEKLSKELNETKSRK